MSHTLFEESNRPWLFLSGLMPVSMFQGKQATKGRSKKPAAAPLAVKATPEKQKEKNPLFEKRPRNFGIGKLSV